MFQVIFIQICTYNPILFKIAIDKTHCVDACVHWYLDGRECVPFQYLHTTNSAYVVLIHSQEVTPYKSKSPSKVYFEKLEIAKEKYPLQYPWAILYAPRFSK